MRVFVIFTFIAENSGKARLDSGNVSRRRTFSTVLDSELYVLAFSQGLETLILDSGEVYEHIFAAVSRSDEAKAFRLVKPLNLTFHH
jgi:hypothetical protein